MYILYFDMALPMHSQESILSKAAEIQAQCQPCSFEDLYGLAISFHDLTVSCVELRQGGRVGKDVLHEIVSLQNLLGACVYDARAKGLLQQTDGVAKLKKGDKKIVDLGRKLYEPHFRSSFLYLLLSSSAAFLAISLLEGADPEEKLVGWQILIGEVRLFPTLAKLATKVRIEEARTWGYDRIEETRRELREKGFEFIDLWFPMQAIEEDAWGAWIQANQEPGRRALALLENCAAKLGRATNFMLHIDTAPWPVEPFNELTEGASMTRMARELCRKELRPLSNVELLTLWLEGIDRANAAAVFAYCFFSEGILRKRKYIVGLPPPVCLTADHLYSSIVKYRDDPIDFMRKNWRHIPNSLHALQLKKELEVAQQALLDARLANKLSESLREVTPEAFALLMVESTGLPHVVSLFLTPLFRRFFDLLYKHRDS